MGMTNNCKGGKLGHPDKRDFGYIINFEKSDSFCIYMIVNTITNKKYIGLTSKKLFYRIQTHFSDLSNRKHKNINLQRSYDLYGANVFSVSCLDKSAKNKEELGILEDMYVNEYSSMAKHGGYNIAIPGIIVTQTDATKLKLSKLAKQRAIDNPKLFLNFLNTTKEAKEKGIIKRQIWIDKNPNPTSRPIIAYNKYSGKQYFFWCVREAAKFLYINASSINRRLIKDEPTNYKGVMLPYHFAYYNN